MKLDLRHTLDQLVAQHTLNGVLETLRHVCDDRADAARDKDDPDLADIWREATDGISHALRTTIPSDI